MIELLIDHLMKYESSDKVLYVENERDNFKDIFTGFHRRKLSELSNTNIPNDQKLAMLISDFKEFFALKECPF